MPFKLVANKRRSPSAGTMLGHRQRRWNNTAPALGECVVFAGSPRLTFPPTLVARLTTTGRLYDAVSLQPIHTPDLFIYINNDLI